MHAETLHPRPSQNIEGYTESGAIKNPRRRRKKATRAADDSTKQTGAVPTNNRKNRNSAKNSVDEIKDLNLPQLKLVLRNVGDVDKHGTDEKMVSFVRDLIKAANVFIASRLSGSTDGHYLMEAGDHLVVPLTLDEQSVERAVASSNTDENLTSKDENGASDADTVVERKCISAMESSSINQAVNMATNTTLVRLLYVVPTHKSRRRGEIPGRAYILLLPPIPVHVHEKMNMGKSDAKFSSEKTDEDVDPSTITTADRSKALAQSRIILSRTLNQLEKMLSADSLNEPRFRKVRVEKCVNNKTWNPTKVPSPMDSTLEKSDDFKAFMENRARVEEERSRRPKPIAGGFGDSSRETVGQGTNTENGMPISALLLHLRARRENNAKNRKESKKSTRTKPDKPDKPKMASNTDDPKSKRKSQNSKKGRNDGSGTKTLSKRVAQPNSVGL